MMSSSLTRTIVRVLAACALAAVPHVKIAGAQAPSATVSIDASDAGRRQWIDGFGTALNDDYGNQEWFRTLYLDDLKGSIVRMDLTPRFGSPYSDSVYYSPWFGSQVPFPGPDRNNARTYSGPTTYSREYGGFHPPIAVMGPDIEANIAKFDFTGGKPATAGAFVNAAQTRLAQLGDFKLMGSIFSPAPWLKIASGNTFSGTGVFPTPNTPFPFIWNGNFAGGFLDVSNLPLEVFNDGTGPTSALTQFARSTAAYLRGFQRAYNVSLYAVSLQNELNFEQFFDSCSYRLASQFGAALKVLRAELDRYPDLAGIRLIGPEDLLIDTPYALWQFGGGEGTIHKNLRYLHELREHDQEALAALDFFAVHARVNDQTWTWWANGWDATPTGTLPMQLAGFRSYGRKSWMTETSGDVSSWPTVADGNPDQGALSMAMNIHRALTTGQQSAWLHWQFAEGKADEYTLTDQAQGANAPKYVAAKHYFRSIRPDAQRVEALVAGNPDVLASAYVHDTNETVTIVLINKGVAASSARVSLAGLEGAVASWATYTSSSGALWQEASAPSDGEEAEVVVPAFGMVTLHGKLEKRRGLEGVYELIVSHSGMVLDDPGFGGSGTGLIQWPANGGLNQAWRVEPTGAETYRLVCVANGLVAGVMDFAAGRRVVIDFDSGTDAQRWRFEPRADGTFLIVNKASGQAMDVFGAWRQAYTPVIQWPVHEGLNQRWTLRPR